MGEQNNENGGQAAEKNKKKFIDLHMIPAKLAYFCIGGIFGANLPFLNIFLRSIGLTTSQAGIITGVSYGVAALTGPLWGTLADWTGCRRAIYMILCLGTIGVMFPLPWIANAIAKVEHRNATCASILNSSTHALNATGCDPDDVHLLNQHTTFMMMLPITTIATVFAVSVPTYTASVVLNVVKNHKRKATFGQQRVFASISGCIGNVLSGLASDHYHSGNMSHYTATFFVLLPYLIFLIPFSQILMRQSVWADSDKKDDDNNNNNGESKPDVKLSTHLLSVLGNIDTVVFMISVMISGLAYETFMNFLFLLMDDELHTSKFVMTIAMTTGGAASILVFPFSSKIIKLFKGPIPCIAIGIFTYSIRYSVMSYTTLPWLMIAIQILQGFGYALSWASILEHTCIISPKEVTMTMVTIVGSLHNVASTSIANILGGFLFQHYGGRVLFRGGALVCGAWSVFMIIYFSLRRCYKKKSIEGENETNIAPEMELGPASLLCTPALGRHNVNIPKDEKEVLGNVLKVLTTRDVELGRVNMVCNNRDEFQTENSTQESNVDDAAKTVRSPNPTVYIEDESDRSSIDEETKGAFYDVNLGTSNSACDEIDSNGKRKNANKEVPQIAVTVPVST